MFFDLVPVPGLRGAAFVLPSQEPWIPTSSVSTRETQHCTCVRGAPGAPPGLQAPQSPPGPAPLLNRPASFQAGRCLRVQWAFVGGASASSNTGKACGRTSRRKLIWWWRSMPAPQCGSTGASGRRVGPNHGALFRVGLPPAQPTDHMRGGCLNRLMVENEEKQ